VDVERSEIEFWPGDEDRLAEAKYPLVSTGPGPLRPGPAHGYAADSGLYPATSLDWNAPPEPEFSGLDVSGQPASLPDYWRGHPTRQPRKVRGPNECGQGDRRRIDRPRDATAQLDAARQSAKADGDLARRRSRIGFMAFDLDRFALAQLHTYDGALEELRRGRKTGHWIWFIFPQVAGLGHSAMSETYAITSLDEARAYLAHPVLGARLRKCAGAVLEYRGRTAEEIFGPLDAMKLRSCMTLFHRAAPDELVFARVLDRFYGGIADEATEERLR
jgi:uncharacterized protein (DUF1810 family)